MTEVTPNSRTRPWSRARLQGLIEGPLGIWLLVVFALLEATVFPGPTEAMLIALVLARRDRALRYAGSAVIASIAGGVIGYHAGAALFEGVLAPLFTSYGYMGHADRVSALYRDNALLALSSSGYTPIPYMLYTALAGASDVSLPTFVTGSLIGRTLKYVPIAAIAWLLGPRVHEVLRRYGALAAAAVLVLVAVLLLVS